MKKYYLTTIGWIISLGLLFSLGAKLNLAEFWRELKEVSLAWILAAGCINIVVILFKAIRWKWLTQHGSRLSVWNSFRANIIGMAGNNLLPARGGDIMKIYLLDKWAGTGKAALATIATLDKLFDGIAILALFLVLSFNYTFPVWVRKGTIIFSSVIALVIILGVFFLVLGRKNSSGIARGKLGSIVEKISHGLAALSNKNLIFLISFNSILICLLQILTLWCCQMAFGQDLNLWIPSLVFVAINLAIMVPSAPSGLGPFEVAAVLIYASLGLGKETATNIALVYHLVQIIPTTIIGMAFYFISTYKTQIKPAAGAI